MRNTCGYIFWEKVQILMYALVFMLILSCSTPAYAFQGPGSINTGIIAIKSSTGTIPGVSNNVYSAMEGDMVVYSIIFHRLLSPDHLDIAFEQGIKFQEITETAAYGESPLGEIDWELKEVERTNAGIVRIDLSNLPEHTDQLTIQVKCLISDQLAKAYDGSCVKATFFSKADGIQQEFLSPKIYGLHMKIQTTDSSLQSDLNTAEETVVLNGKGGLTYRLYYDKDMLAAVNFLKDHDGYTACQTLNDHTVCDLESVSGEISLNGLKEDIYYLAQIQDDACKKAVPLCLTGDVKFDPDDPSNKKKHFEKEKGDDTYLSEATKKVLEAAKKKKEMEEAARYHATHLQEYVTAVKLSKNVPSFVSANNSESEAVVVWDCNPHRSFILGLKKAAVLLGCVCGGAVVGVVIYRKKQKHDSSVY